MICKKSNFRYNSKQTRFPLYTVFLSTWILINKNSTLVNWEQEDMLKVGSLCFIIPKEVRFHEDTATTTQQSYEIWPMYKYMGFTVINICLSFLLTWKRSSSTLFKIFTCWGIYLIDFLKWLFFSRKHAYLIVKIDSGRVKMTENHANSIFSNRLLAHVSWTKPFCTLSNHT